ncbi:LOW QUALITY PROTEIN: AF4/FMR2 family member 1-like [Strix aluco]|uniref:LOW QUALITY PROTEIN: AF4/FMR2 family member 1-like n=1 Tax=Strix aluco TaxID=111821 RepID=UPI003DA35A81
MSPVRPTVFFTSKTPVYFKHGLAAISGVPMSTLLSSNYTEVAKQMTNKDKTPNTESFVFLNYKQVLYGEAKASGGDRRLSKNTMELTYCGKQPKANRNTEQREKKMCSETISIFQVLWNKHDQSGHVTPWRILKQPTHNRQMNLNYPLTSNIASAKDRQKSPTINTFLRMQFTLHFLGQRSRVALLQEQGPSGRPQPRRPRAVPPAAPHRGPTAAPRSAERFSADTEPRRAERAAGSGLCGNGPAARPSAAEEARPQRAAAGGRWVSARDCACAGGAVGARTGAAAGEKVRVRRREWGAGPCGVCGGVGVGVQVLPRPRGSRPCACVCARVSVCACAAPPRSPSPSPDPPPSNKWQLSNWLTKVNPPAAPTEILSKIAPGDGCEEGKEQGQGLSSNSSQQCTEPREPQHESSDQAAVAPQDVHLLIKDNCQKSPVQEPSPRQTAGVPPVHEGPKGGLKVESDPGPLEGRDQSARDKTKVKSKGKPGARKRDLERKTTDTPDKSLRKRKVRGGGGDSPLAEVAAADWWFLGSSLPKGAVNVPPASGSGAQRVGCSPMSSGRKVEKAVNLSLSWCISVLGGSGFMVASEARSSCQTSSAAMKKQFQAMIEVLEPCPEHTARGRRCARHNPLSSITRAVEKKIYGKKKKSEKETKSSQSSTDKDSSKLKASKASLETQRKVLLPLPLPRVSPAPPAPKSTKTARKRPRSESDELLAMDNTARNKSNHTDPLLSKHRKEERNHADLSEGIKGSAGDVTNPFRVTPLPDGTSKPRRPQLKFENQHPVEYYIEEVGRLKHKADAMTDKTGRAFQYLDAALSFIEFGIALESDATEPKSASSVFSGTIDLLKFVMTLKSFMDSSASSHDKIFAVLYMRCQSLLHMAMCHYNKDTAIRYSRILNDHFRSSSRLTQAPSPCVLRITGMPSHPSAMPCPASSVSSQPGLNASNCSGNSTGSSFPVPCNIPNITSSYINTTSYIIYMYDFWEKADALAGKNPEFFAELSTVTCALALNSSVTKLVHYARQGLQWLRVETTTP